MTDIRFQGRCWLFGDNIPTDQLVRADLVFGSLEEIKKHVLENLNPAFPREVREGDVVVAGRHFGQSSGRAIATRALKATGIGCVVAESFARTFYRNAFEIALPVLECPGISERVADGDLLSVDLRTGEIVNRSSGVSLQAAPPAPFLLQMLEAGGLIPLAGRLAGEGTT